MDFPVLTRAISLTSSYVRYIKSRLVKLLNVTKDIFNLKSDSLKYSMLQAAYHLNDSKYFAIF